MLVAWYKEPGDDNDETGYGKDVSNVFVDVVLNERFLVVVEV